MYSKLAILLFVAVGMAQCTFLYTPNSSYGGSYGQQSSYGSSNNGYPASSSINRQDTTNGHRIFGVARSYHYGTFNPRYGGGYDGNNFRNDNGYSNNNLYGLGTSNRYGINNNGGYGYNLNNNQGSSNLGNNPNSGLNGNNLNRGGNYGYGSGYGYNAYGYGSTNNNGQGQINSSYRSNGNY